MPYLNSSARRALRLVSALGLLLPPALMAQGQGQGQGPGPGQGGTLVGRVLAGDVAVPSATIIAGRGRVVLTRVDGRYRLAVPAGRYEVRARRVGYTTVRDSVTITAGQTSTMNFKLERSAVALEAVSAVGSRGQVRRVLDAPIPIDVIAATDLRATGRTETAQMIQALEPGVNAPRASVPDVSDVIHPFTLRGMGTDQVLVLVNGKRRHTSALMNVNGSVGHGSTGVDLNAIPASMIDHVEILRDGATAQYGTDAVAGVVNIVLKSGVHGDASTTMGRNATTYVRDGDGTAGSIGDRSASDGSVVQTSIDKGIVFGERGFLHGGFELRDRGMTNRSFIGPNDPRGSTTKFMDRFGDPHSHDVVLFFNGSNLFANGLETYGNVGGSRRHVDAEGPFYATASPAGTGLTSFRPTLNSITDDYSGSLGVRGQLGEWDWDLSSTYGRNNVSSVVTLIPVQTRFGAGESRYGQSTSNLELSRSLDIFDETRVIAGAEFRRESYRQGAAESGSGFPASGAPQTSDHSRHDVAGYVDLEMDLTNRILVGLAGRVEDYPEFGTNGAGKLSLRWEPLRKQVLRASAERGFRVPSMAQLYYSQEAVSSVGAVLSHSYAGLGSTSRPALTPERNMTYSAGIASEPTGALSLTADIYLIEVKDRIILHPSSLAVPINQADTRTSGFAVTAGYSLRSADAGALRLTGGVDASSTTVTDPQSSDETRELIERGQPRSTLLGSADFKNGAFGALLRTQRFGEVTAGGFNLLSTGSPFVRGHTFSAKWITDANASFTLVRKYTLTVGADNIFDMYPERSTIGAQGAVPYSGISPFGFNGRFIFGRLSIYL